jgi:hypothetical protein
VQLEAGGERGITRQHVPGELGASLVIGDPEWYSPAATEAARATRKRVTPARLAEVAQAWREAGIDGITALGVSERQAWRLKARAKEAGLLTGIDDKETQ